MQPKAKKERLKTWILPLMQGPTGLTPDGFKVRYSNHEVLTRIGASGCFFTGDEEMVQTLQIKMFINFSKNIMVQAWMP
jgi:hypothetical protein